MSKQTVAGLDIGGTKIAVALADTDGNVISHTRFDTRVELGPHRILERALAEIERMREETGTHLVALGVGCGGPLDRERGLILSPPNLPDWDEFPIIEIIEKRLGIPALLDNDANAAALGEFNYGAGRGLSNIVYITISTGIGGGIIIKGQIFHGVNDGAGEVGHITVLPDGPACGCGGRGCLEAICSGTSIARRARERLLAGAHSSITTMAGEINAVTAKVVAEAVRTGDKLAAEIWDETTYYLAVGISNIINVLAPEAVILGGGVSTAGELLLEPLRRQVQSRNTMLPPDKINILQAALGGDSGSYGALILGQNGIASKEHDEAVGPGSSKTVRQ
ncbi:MAG TPA: ROK family protein [Pyrinomonadaceae bacterium]|jgi:glucokinase